MKLLPFSFCILFTSILFAQNDSASGDSGSGSGKKFLGLEVANFTLGAGFNAIDNTALSSENSLFDIDKNWNIFPFISVFSADYGWYSSLTSGMNISYNRLNTSILQNNNEIEQSVGYFAIDITTRWYPVKTKNFDAFVTGSVSGLVAGGKPGAAAGIGLGVQSWFSENYGVRLEALGKVHPLHEYMGKSHAQYNLSFLYSIGGSITCPTSN